MPRRLTLLIRAIGLAALVNGEEAWWEEEPLRIIDLTTSMSRIDYRDPMRLAREKAELGYNAEHLEVMAMPAGLDDLGFFFKSKVAAAPHVDYLGPYLTAAKKQGIRTFIYFNVHYYSMRFAAEHPDWREIRQNGHPLEGVYDTGASFCVNTPWRDWVFQVVRDLAAYPIDGIFYDGPTRGHLLLQVLPGEIPPALWHGDAAQRRSNRQTLSATVGISGGQYRGLFKRHAQNPEG